MTTTDIETGLTLEQLRSASPDVLTTLMHVHGGRALALARKILQNEEDAQDAVQDAFLSIYKALPNFDGQSKTSTWIHRVAINAALMKLRKRKSIHEVQVDDLMPKFKEDGHHLETPKVWRATAVAELLEEENRTIIHEKIAQLPEIYRDVIILRDIKELDTAETAKSLDITEAMVKTRLHRARQALRALLEPHFAGIGNKQ